MESIGIEPWRFGHVELLKKKKKKKKKGRKPTKRGREEVSHEKNGDDKLFADQSEFGWVSNPLASTCATAGALVAAEDWRIAGTDRREGEDCKSEESQQHGLLV